MTIRNLTAAGKNPVPKLEATVESEPIMPLVRGRNVSRWQVSRGHSIIFVQDPENHWIGLPETELKRKFPKTYGFLHKFEKQLRSRKPFVKYLAPQGAPFYTIRDVGEYTYAPYKTLWREQASGMISAVIDSSDWEKLPIVDHKLILVPLQDRDEAFYLCGVLNSAVVDLFVRAYAVLTQISTHVTKFIRIPTFEPGNQVHRRISALANSCHESAKKGVGKELRTLQNELDETVRSLWGISPGELQKIKRAIALL